MSLSPTEMWGDPRGLQPGNGDPEDRALRSFYRRPEVQARMAEYLGGEPPSRASAVYMTSPTPRFPGSNIIVPARTFADFLERELEAARSLWDRESLLVHLDLEHVHFDRPWEPLADRRRSRLIQTPVVAAVERILQEYGIEPLRLLTGRGSHLVWRVDPASRIFEVLVRLGNPGPELRERYRYPVYPPGRAVGERLGAAQEGLGKVLEFLGHRVLEHSGDCIVPVQLTAVVVGPGSGGREIVSLDLSQFGDPLDRRSIRMPFTAYRKARRMGAPADVSAELFMVVPVVGGEEEAALQASQSLEAAGDLARRSRLRVPDATVATENLVVDYLGSDLHRFHREFDATLVEPRERWPETYDRLEPRDLPPCLGQLVERPNDLLLQPAVIQHLVRGLMALGWHSRHVAGLLRSKYERDHGWVPGTHFHEPGVRADFYTRLFAGLLACGMDPLVDFNCRSAAEKGLCPGGNCGLDLRELHGPLLGLEGTS